ncbi:sodium-dependent transporter [Candidatus Gracilibacteria bacterium]|nr:sodium-dependent transporter [Candidatus Gracilibacteria bacterium]
MTTTSPESRSRWFNNVVYILAAIGCAAGLGNLWRFPMLAYEYGGAAFIIALLLTNIFIVLPLVMMETLIGQKHQLSAPQAFEKLKRGTSWIQWIAVFTVIVILFYYMPVLAWGVKYLVMSFSGDFLADPANYFMKEIIHLSDGVTIRGSFQWSIFGALIVSYLFVLYSLRKNTDSLSGIVKITATAPFLLLAILLVRGVTLPGAAEGLKMFFLPDWSALGDIKLWQAAMGQAFLSASLAAGYFIVAGSHRPKTAEIPKSSLWILVGNFAVSLLAGIAVFATLGFMATQQGVPVSEVSQGGPMLVFSVLPTAVSLMPFGAIFFAVLLFLIVITLGIDSVFGIMEVAVGGFHDLKKKGKAYIITLVKILILVTLGSIPFLFSGGLYYLDITDHFVNGYCLLLVGMLETAVVAYFLNPNEIRLEINKTSSWKLSKLFNITLMLVPLILGALIVASLVVELKELYGGYPLPYIVGFGFVPLALIIIFALGFGIWSKDKNF